MQFEYLSSNAESLLSEIISQRDEHGNCLSDYWEGRFADIPFAEECLLRSTFLELKERDMIFVQWADNYPYHLGLLNAGVSYSEQKERYERTLKAESRKVWVQCLFSGLGGVILTLLLQYVVPLVRSMLSNLG